MRKCYLSFLFKTGILSIALVLTGRLSAQVTVTIGAGSNTGTTSNSSAADAGPMYCTGPASNFVFSKHHMVYTAAELAAAGIPAGVLITKIEWNKANNAAYSSSSAAIFDIYLKNSSASGVPSSVPQSFASVIAGATQVYASTTQSFPATIGWVEFNLSTPFLYTGNALELSTNWDISAGGSTASGATANFAWAKDPGINILSYAGSSQSADLTFLRTTRAQIRITYVPASPCTTPPNPGSATASPATPICTGTNVQLGLSGSSFGTGQTYVWQSAASSGGSYTDISASSSSSYLTVSPTTTTWYRCAVTCSGNTQYSTPVAVVVNPAFPGGTYTINAALPTGGTNFQSFTDAVSALNCGIAGPVVFNVTPGSGPYIEQITIPQIGGTSSVNTVTFKGNLETLSFNSTNTNARAGITLNGADHIIIDSLIIDGTAGTYGWGVHLTNQADSNTISNCYINISPTITTSNHAGIVISGSASSATTGGNNGNYNTITGNSINGGYYGIILYGSTTAGAQNLNNKAQKNNVTNAYGYSIYVSYQSGAVVDSNDISRPARTSVLSGGAGIYLTTGNINTMVSRNRIHNMVDAAPTSTATLYNIYVSSDGAAGQENKIINNLIYNSGGNGAVYGIYNTGGEYMQVYHNTIVLDDQIATTGAAYGIYQTGVAAGLDYKNNIVYVSRTGTGIKRCIYFVTTTSTISCNYNILFLNATGGTNNHLGQFGTTNYTSFADWQTANSSAFDQQSVNVDPQFANTAAGDYTPGNAQANNTGINVGVSNDILGNTRSNTTPDAGAYEFSLLVAGINMSAEALVTPTVVATGCYTATETVTIRIRNNGTTTINFTTHPVTVTVNVTGAVTQTLTANINSGTLASDATLDVVLPGVVNMSAAGVYTFNAFTTVAGDSNPADDTMPAIDRIKVALNAGTISATPDVVCVSQPTGPVLSSSGESGYTSLQWQQSATSGSGFTDIPGATTIPYTAASPTQNTYYRLVAGCGTNTQTSSEVLVTFTNPQVTSTTPASRCGPGTVTLGATGSAGTTIKWYDVATGGTELATGNSFVTPVINSTTTYYASANTGGGGIQHVGAPDLSIGASAVVGTYYMNFTVFAPLTIQSVNCYFNATGAPFVINIRNASNLASVFTYSGTTSVSGTSTPQVVMINATLQPGNYQIGWTTDPGTYRNSSGGSYPYTLPGFISITGNTFNDPNYYYYFYNWAIVTGCESNRTPVTATISTAPAFTVAQDTTICNNAITALSVSSNLADYTSYVWSPTTGLFTDNAATIPYTGGSAATVYAKIGTAGLHKYYINASNTTTSCTNIDSVSVTVLPATLSISATREQICVSGNTTLSVPAGDYGDDIQWYSSSDGVTYAPIAGATSNTYVTPTLTATTHYKLEIKNGAGVVCLQPTIVINVGTPQVLTTTPASRCGPGTVTLGATAGPASATVNWYSAASGGLPVASGNSFTTPVLSSTTTYYASSIFGNTLLTAGKAAPTTTPLNLTASPRGIQFNATVPVRLQSVTVYSTNATAGSGTIEVRNSAGVTIAGPANVSWAGGGTTTAPIPRVLDLNFDIPAGTGHRLLMVTGTTGGGIGYESSGMTPALWAATASPGGEVQLTASMTSLTGTSATTYYYFYDWQISVGCESARTPVTATINPGPAFSVARDSVVCNNAITALSVESSLANFDSYTWSPTSGLFTDAAATIPYTGGSATTLYAKIATAGIHKYYIQANNSSTLCSGIDSVALTVLPASLSLSATRTEICQSGSTSISLPPGDYGTASIQWYTSSDGVAYSPIAGATGISYTTPTLTVTTYYKVEIKNGAGNICLQPTIAINVGIPEVIATSPAVRCDPGTVTIGATPGPAGATINWYENATGGLPIATGNTFTTPVLSATTTYYAASSFGFTVLTAGKTAPTTTPSNLTASPRGIQFNATVPVRLQSVTVLSTNATAGSGTIEVRNSAGVTIAGPANVSWAGGGTTTAPIPRVLDLNFDIPAGTGHRLLMVTGTTGGGIAYESSGMTPALWAATASPGGEVQLTASMTSLTGTSATTYYYFYDWKISIGCESPRVPVEATINGEITIDAAPVNQALCSDGQDVVFSVSATGAISNYQWRKNGVNIPGANASIYTVANASAADVGSYDVIVTGPCDIDTSSAASLIISSPTVITTDPVAQQVCAGGSVTFHATATGSGSLGYQWRKDGVDIVGAYGSSFTINNITAADVGNYDVVVTGTCNKDTSNAAALVIGDATTVTTQPAGQVVCAGSTVTFTAAGTGSGTLSYQWRKGGVNIAGATSSSFTISGVTVADAGNYDVLITGNCGTAISSVAGLVVNAATVITSQPVAQSSCLNSNVTFSVTATGSGNLTYQWRKDGVNISGATSSSLTLTNVTAADIASYDVVVTGTCGAVTSTAAGLTISAPGTWIGVLNSDWNNAANWCGTVPTSSTDVFIPAFAPNMPVLSSTGFARNIVIDNGASLAVIVNGILNLYGNISGTGTFTATAGNLVFRGTAPQTTPGFTATNVTMNGTGGFIPGGNITITGVLTLTNGNITLGANNLRLSTGSTGSLNSHIITNGAGRVIVAGLAASSTRIIPVGISATSYTPVVLAANPGHTTDDLLVRVQAQVLANGTTGTRLTRFVVDRTWFIDEAVPGGSNVNITLQWNQDEELQDFGRNECYVMQYSGNTWVTGTESFAAGTNPYTQTKSNVTSFSPFAVQTDPLPIVSAGIFPNPTSSILNMVVRTNAPEQLTVSVFDLNGRLLKRKAQSVGFGGTLLSVDVIGLAAGTYVVKVSTPANRELLVRKFVKVN